ncbi:MAG TPA: hypothetical protein PL048_08400 [Leptospiraceae bacterium]|nr:hypothetical protein [Leptospiraceae bacterium]HMZ58783.1 hypothetical protein [Leptospiraceae bacterium]HNH07611.1 hypothetical protein [Leptospiraceae bacterium]HNI25163.1 hypothetical protein [Leptospiraceae bacterium]
MKLFKEIADLSMDQKEEISLLNAKYDQLALEHFSISSLNSFRENRMTWAVRYLLKKYSSYPKPSMIRGQALEAALWNYVSGSSTDSRVYMDRYFKTKTLLQIIGESKKAGLYPVIPPEWKNKQGQIAGAISQFGDEKYWQTVLDIFENLHKIQGDSLREYMLPDSLESLYKKMKREYQFIHSSFDDLIEYGEKFRSRIDSVKYQNRVTGYIAKIEIPVIGFTDFELPEYGVDLKTSLTKPNEKKLSQSHICQCAFYSEIQNKPWKLAYVTPVSSDDKKKSVFHKLYSRGLSADDIAKQYKNFSPDGKGTTKPTVEKFLTELLEGSWKEPKGVTEIEVSEKQTAQGKILNQLTARAIQHIINSCKQENLIEDMKIFCVDKPDGMMADPIEKEMIREVWGLDSEEEQD